MAYLRGHGGVSELQKFEVGFIKAGNYPPLRWQSLFSGMDYWNGLLEWTTGMPFDLKFSHKNPIGVWDSVITLLSS